MLAITRAEMDQMLDWEQDEARVLMSMRRFDKIIASISLISCPLWFVLALHMELITISPPYDLQSVLIAIVCVVPAWVAVFIGVVSRREFSWRYDTLMSNFRRRLGGAET